MNWDAIGAIAELVGAVGVIGSLVYLGTQIRHGARAQRAATLQAFSEAITQAGNELAHDEKLQVVLNGMSDFGSLPEDDRFRVHLVLTGLFRRFENLVLQQGLALVDPEIAAAFLKPVHAMASMPGVQEWWKQWRGIFSPQFAKYVEEAISNPEFDPPPGFVRMPPAV